MAYRPRIYVAAPWVKKIAALGVKAYLVSQGLQVTSTWTEQPDGANDDPSQRTRTMAEYAMSDLNELLNANVLVLLHPQVCSQGKASEFGIAYNRFMTGHMRHLYVVGDDGTKKGNVFYHLPHVTFVEAAVDVVSALKREAAYFEQGGR
jgi:hypothetical protein